MQILYAFGALLLSYLIGSIPIGWIIVKISTGRDIRWIESGRTGGTNVMRAAGFLAGLLTGIGDIAKGILAVSVSRWLTPDGTLLRQVTEIAGPLLAIVGHNYSIYLLERLASGKLVLRGGAGGATCFGGAVGLWAPVALYVFPLAAIIYIVVGYASITTMSIALRAVLELGPWHYVLYGLIAEVLLVWALRPNLQRLRQGTERLHGLRVWLKKAR
jgi:glycerol-3-phosphate acyltransferase PlsY